MRALLRSWWDRLVSPVPQSRLTVLYGEYRGMAVRKVPVVHDDRPWLIKAWINDPDQCAAIDEMLAAKSNSTGKGTSESEQTGTPAMPPLPPDSPDEPDVNPASVNGL